MTGADVIDILESVINEVFCNGCAERRLVRGTRESGVPTEPDDELCPVGFDYTSPLCARCADYAELVERAGEVAALLSDLETRNDRHVDEMR